MKLLKSKGISEIITALEKNNSINVQFYLSTTLLNMFSDEKKVFYIPLRKEVVYKHMNLNKFWSSQRDKYIDELDNRDINPSGLTFYGVKMLEIIIFRNTSDGGCSYFDLSDDIKNKKAVINVKNTDNKCFMRSVLAPLHPEDIHPERIAEYVQWKSKLSFKGITFPVPVWKVQKFEKLNNIMFNVYTTESMIRPRFYTLYCGSKMYDKTVNLLLVSNGTEKHYCCIRNLSRLIHS